MFTRFVCNNRTMLTTALALIALYSKFDLTPGITYRTVAGTELKADLYRPALPAAEPAPFVVVIHGGGWASGKREDMAQFCQGLAEQGIASATVSYRLSPQHRWPAHIEDVQASVRYFRANAAKYRIDPTNFAIGGASAGGHLAMLAAYSAPWEKDPKEHADVPLKVNAVLNIFGPTDLTRDYNEAIATFLTQQVLGRPYSATDDIIKKLGPIAHITKDAPPTFTIHGETDPLVPVMQARRLDDALKAVGVPHTLRIIPNMGHTLDVGNEDCVKALVEAVAFLKQHTTKPTLVPSF